MVAQISSCSIFEDSQFRLLEEPWLKSYHLQNKGPDFLNVRNSHVLADLSQSEGQICRGKLFYRPPWCPFQRLVDETSIAILQKRQWFLGTGHRRLTFAKSAASDSAIFFNVTICCGYAFANDPYGDVFSNRIRELLVYFGTLQSFIKRC
jgi:hypothetical protein